MTNSIEPKLIKVFQEGDVNAVKEALTSFSVKLVTPKNQQTALHLLCSRKKLNKEMLKSAITAGCSLKARDFYGNTPLHLLCLNGATVPLLKILVDGGANVNSQNELSFTPLHYLCWKNCDSQLLTYLTSAGANVKVTTPKNVGVLHMICLADPGEEELEILTELGAPVNIANDKGLTPLHIYCTRPKQKIEVVQEFILKGAQVDKPDFYFGNTPLFYACSVKNPNLEIISFLKDRGADGDKKNFKGATPKQILEKYHPDLSSNIMQTTKLDDNMHSDEENISLDKNMDEIKKTVDPSSYQEIDPKKLITSKELGKGGFKTVYLGTWIGCKVAIGKLHKTVWSRAQLEEFKTELAFIYSLHYPNVVRFYGASTADPKNMRIVSEFCSGGDLFRLVHGTKKQLAKKIPLMRKLEVLYDIACGVQYLHSKGIVHSDLKTQNVLLDGDGRALLTDFGLSKTVEASKQTDEISGTPPYMPPEQWRKERKTTKLDIYAFGVIIWEVMRQEIPWKNVRNIKQVQELRENILKGSTLPVGPKNIFQNLIKRCFKFNKEDRPEISECIEEIREKMKEYK
ncbi:serine/threonine-protein kinase tnni3k-related [Anaeramoeba flamelloides]|uniref:Serine/threonine-protein kinase tnni3k-related n=1 Tax=Anaeramoeba flamelloides TaxID=1746091 RepID=A0ABQ8XXT5_9EUKA|nr:serine/threonine-protein kinase tnni3k-related [Anaeramoeba flamelloides]